MAKGAKLTNKEFKMIKKLLNAGLSHQEVVDLTKRGMGTVSYIDRSDSLDGYHQLTAAADLKRRAKLTQADKAKGVPVSLSATSADFDFKLLNDNLVLMSQKFAGFTKAVEELKIAIYALRKAELEQQKPSTSLWRHKK